MGSGKILEIQKHQSGIIRGMLEREEGPRITFVTKLDVAPGDTVYFDVPPGETTATITGIRRPSHVGGYR